MNISLTPKLEDFVKNKVESGLYTSSSEVIREALRLLEAKESSGDMQAKLIALKLDIAQGVESLSKGQGKPFDVDAIKAEARKRLGG